MTGETEDTRTIPRGWYSPEGYHWCTDGKRTFDVSTGTESVLVIVRENDEDAGLGSFLPIDEMTAFARGWLDRHPDRETIRLKSEIAQLRRQVAELNGAPEAGPAYMPGDVPAGTKPTDPKRFDASGLYGLYRVYWKDGGSSLASIGMLGNGDRWLAPVNWIHPTEDQDIWDRVARVKLIER